jgi:hypothetical protein
MPDGTCDTSSTPLRRSSSIHRQQLLPQRLRSLGGIGQEGAVAFVGFVVALDEVAHVDAFLPRTGIEPAPRALGGPRAQLEVEIHRSPPSQ